MLLAEGKNVGAGVILHVVETTVIPTVSKMWQGSKTSTVSTCKQWVQSVRLQMHSLPLVFNWSSSRLIPESCTVHEERQFLPRSPLWTQAKTWEKFLFMFFFLALVGRAVKRHTDILLNGCSHRFPPLRSNPSFPQTFAQQKSCLTAPNWWQHLYWLLQSMFLEKKVLKRVYQEPDFNTQIASSLLQSAGWHLADRTPTAN